MGKENFMVVGVSERDFHNPKVSEYVLGLSDSDLKVFRKEGKEIIGVRVEDSGNKKKWLKNVHKAMDRFLSLAFGGLLLHTPKVFEI